MKIWIFLITFILAFCAIGGGIFFGREYFPKPIDLSEYVKTEAVEKLIDDLVVEANGSKFTIVENTGLDTDSKYIVYCYAKCGTAWYSYSVIIDFETALYQPQSNSYLWEAATYNTPTALGWNKVLFFVEDGEFVADAGYSSGALLAQVMLVIRIG